MRKKNFFYEKIYISLYFFWVNLGKFYPVSGMGGLGLLIDDVHIYIISMSIYTCVFVCVCVCVCVSSTGGGRWEYPRARARGDDARTAQPVCVCVCVCVCCSYFNIPLVYIFQYHVWVFLPDSLLDFFFIFTWSLSGIHSSWFDSTMPLMGSW